MTNEGLQLKAAEAGGGREGPGCKEPPAALNDSAWQLGRRHGAGGRRRQMTRSKMMVTGSYPTQSAPSGGCLLLGNSGGSASAFFRETSRGASRSSTRTEGIWWWCVMRKACGQGAEVLLVSSEEIGLSVGHPEESSINPVSRQSSAQLLNVLGVARLQGSFVKHPVLISWGGVGRAGSHSTWGLWRSQVEHAPPGRPAPHPKTMAECLVTFEEDKLAILPLIGSVDGCG